MKYIITGGVGFIGNVIIGALNKKGIKNIYVVDELDESEKWKNLVNKDYLDYFDKDLFLNLLETGKFKLEKDDIIIHMGAISATTEKDSNKLMNNNTKYTYTLFKESQKVGASFIYASSAATYGNGDKGYDDRNYDLEPLNMYGYSKHLLDKYIIRDTNDFNSLNGQVVGLKFFNVYGPNEYFKGTMSSVVFHGFNQIKKDGIIKLFKSYKEGFLDGEQKRDFIYILDIIKVIDFFIENRNISGIYNVGTGVARTFKDLAIATFSALSKDNNIEYIDMPEGLKEKYQYFTESDMSKLREVGYKENFYTLEEGVKDYVQNYLDKGFKIY
ncbi:MAG: ADP-glyceromanno-heptose 6-epimerase [Candidatus Gracilibacteria bacterium]|nr:ADP-glyceromanno-heptose 6-epimerase [Candidatus Gracilibacteria bacterium]